MVRNWIVYGFMLLLSILYIYATNSRMAYITLYTFLILPAFSWVSAYISKYFFEFTEHIDSDFIVRGDEVNYKIIMDNKSIFSYSHVSVVFKKDLKKNIKLETDIENKSFRVGGKQKYTAVYKIKCLYRGVFEIGADYIEFKDVLGLIKFKYRIAQKLSLLVYPRVIELNNFPVPLVKLSKVVSNIHMGEEDYSEISDINKYQEQDGFKKIHWKLSAKRNELLIKSYNASVVDNVIVFLSLKRCTTTRNESSVEDRLVESAVALVNFCLNKRVPVEFNYFSDGCKAHTARSIADFKNIYTISASLSLSDDDIIDRIFNDFVTKEIESTNIVLFSSVLDEALVEGIVRAKNFGYNIFLVFIYDKIPEKYYLMLDSIKNVGVAAFLLPENTNISEVCF